MIDFTNVSREFTSLVVRRRELLTLLGSIFAGMGIFLQNALSGSFPDALQSVQDHLFGFYATVLLVASLIISLRMARLHAGMVINGVLFARLMREQDWTKQGNPEKAAKHNPLSASFLQFLIVDLIASFSAAVLLFAFEASLAPAVVSGCVVFFVWLGLYMYFHHSAARFALKKSLTEQCTPFTKNEWEEHVAGSLETTNQDLLGTLSFTGLMMFSLLETLSGLGHVAKDAKLDLKSEDISTFAPAVYVILMLLVCALELLVYLRLRVALGRFSILRDPTDTPFQPLRLTDSLLGYMLLAFLFSVSVYLAQVTLFPSLRGQNRTIILMDVVIFCSVVVAEQLTLVWARGGKSS